MLTDGRGVPLATIVTAANVNDHTALPQLLDARIAIAPPRLERPGLCVDAGYDNAPTEERIAAADYTPHIRRRGEASPAHDPRVKPRRWPVERNACLAQPLPSTADPLGEEGRELAGVDTARQCPDRLPRLLLVVTG